MSRAPIDDPERGLASLREHVAECEACAGNPPAVERIDAVLRRQPSVEDSEMLSQRVLLAARGLLAERRKHSYRRRVRRGLILALAPLPLVVSVDVYLLHSAYTALSSVLPAAIVIGMLASHAAMLALLVALTYASLPLLLAQVHTQASR